MRNYERTIKIAFDVVSKSIIDAELVLKNTQDAFALRKQYNEQKIKPICCECQQELVVSHSRYDRVYFKHKPNHNFCILIDEKLSPNEQEVFISNLQSKESPRHKELKNKIGKLLASENGVDVSSINVDNHFITITNEKRKPDVYCEYNKYKIAFEIQISKLSQKYILSRHNFYKKNGIFLIWILDNFNIHNQTGLERDIKYLNEYQNFFKLDERTESFKLICDFKKSYLTESNQLRTKWINESIALGQLKFNNQIYQAFFYNFDENYKNNEIFQIQKEKAIIEAKAEVNSKKELLISTQKVENVISKIAKLKNNPDKSRQAESLKFVEYSKLSSMIEFEFTQQEYALLNQKLQFKEFELKHHFSIITYFLQCPEKFDYAFINFILSCTKINFNTRLNDQNDISIFQNIFMHQYRYYEDLVKNYSLEIIKFLIKTLFFWKNYQILINL